MAPSHLSMKKLQSADRVLGRIACFLLKPLLWVRRDPPGVCPPDKVLLIKFWGLGSIQLLTPAVNAIRKRHPNANLTLLTLSGNKEFASGLQVFDTIETLDVAGCGWPRMFARITKLFRHLRRQRYDVVYDFEFFTRFSSVVSLVSGAPVVRGFDAPSVDRGGFHTHRVPFNRYWHVARNFRALAEGETGEEIETSELTRFSVRFDDDLTVREQLTQNGVRGGVPYSVFNVNAGELSLERRWPAENFSELIRRTVLEDGLRIVLIGSKNEVEYTRKIALDAGPLPDGFLVDLSGKLMISEVAALLRGATCVVSNDSGPMHVSAALGTPTLGLFGPETPLMYAPLGDRVRVLWDPPVCSPCINVHDNKVATCIHGRPECLVNLSVERVHEELRFTMCRTILRPVHAPSASAPTAETGGVNLIPAE